MANHSLLDSLFQVIRDYEQNQKQQLEILEGRIAQLEEENKQLRASLDKEASLLDDILDEKLQKRLSTLTNSPLDTLVREAGVVLEDRLRQVGGPNVSSEHGAKLVDAIFAPEKGSLILSKHVGEQQGVLMLFRGAIQFIRNPPMHNIIEYQGGTARILIRLIDTLLRLLSETQTQPQEDVQLKDIRHMLKRIPVPNGQIALYGALYKAGETGLSSSQLATQLGRTRQQMSGLLGALGNRINGTANLENKGGVTLVLDITAYGNGEWLYRMKPILRKALELEKIIKVIIHTS